MKRDTEGETKQSKTMKIIIIDIRGSGCPTKWRYVRDLIKKEGFRIVCLQETKLEIINEEMWYALWGNNDLEWKHVPAKNGAGEF